ncbi:beta-1,4-mannosyltransferas-like protein [Ampelomyces quisqualis]|uniref:Chitobiosyldiphosphodolichol beta-mannosyltransferase n=1 Tax=Ampelomyces quisqualis TaxID=50730 RepID=A0A6A5QXP4_AMPQU|nr:beta-1,4-mannosyltransferas-like protein [Ampelomyces quisqualis]
MGVDMHVEPVFSGAGSSIALNLAVGIVTFIALLAITLPTRVDRAQLALRYVDDDGNELRKIPTHQKGPMKTKIGGTVQIVVLGDIGRSPRMQYHALSIARLGGEVSLIGYRESEIHPDILSSPWIKIFPLSAPPALLSSSSKLLFPILAPLKALWQAFSLYHALGYRSGPCRSIMVQNPPSIPTLAIASLVCFLRKSRLVIDWHNFGYSILALKLGASHRLVNISESYERFFAKTATHHITVTNAMARVLRDDYGVTADALLDRPASHFKPISATERTDFLSRLPETARYAEHFTSASKTPRKLIVSSTSWTADEDFSILLDALSAYSAEATKNTYLPKIVAIITGKGPQKEKYLEQIRNLNEENKLQNVDILTAWLTLEDYALLLASADLGVSLHTSSSGVDLPMKVVDMFGAGLPVVGWGKFEAWPELVKEDVNGKGFDSSQQLAKQLTELFGNSDKLMKQLKEGALKESEFRWDDEWKKVGPKLFDGR